MNGLMAKLPKIFKLQNSYGEPLHLNAGMKFTLAVNLLALHYLLFRKLHDIQLESFKDKSKLQDEFIDAEEVFGSLDNFYSYRERLHPITRFFYDIPRAYSVVIPRMIDTAYYNTRAELLRIFTGYRPVDYFDYFSQNSERAIKLLPNLKGKGYPCSGSIRSLGALGLDNESDKTEAVLKQAMWDSKIDDMIFFHTVCAGKYQEFHEKFGHMMVCDSYQIKNPERKNQYRRGKYYYHKYYESLWD